MRERLVSADKTYVGQPSYRTCAAYDPQWAELTSLGTPSYDALQRREYMEDLPNPPPPCGFKPCVHNKLSGHFLSERRIHDVYYAWKNGVSYEYDLDVPLPTYFNRYATGVLPYLESLVEGSVEPWSHTERWQMSSVWEKTKPHIEPNMDILVFLAEIKEVPELAKSLVGKLRYLTDDVGPLAKKVWKYFDGLRVLAKHEDVGVGGMLKVVMDESTHALSSNWLEYNFALAPTVDDLIGMVSSLFQWEKKVSDLIQGANKKQKAHYSFVSSDELGPEVIHFADCDSCISYYGETCAYSSSRGHHVWEDENVPGFTSYVTSPGGVETRIGLTVFYRYTLPEWLSGVSAKIHGLAAALGCNPGLGTVWDLIPFSFVIDWVLPIGDILERARIDAIPVKTEILDVCWTKRTTRPIVVYSTMGRCALRRTPTAVFQGKLEKFERIVGKEPFTWIPAFEWPNLFQLSLGAALAKTFQR